MKTNWNLDFKHEKEKLSLGLGDNKQYRTRNLWWVKDCKSNEVVNIKGAGEKLQWTHMRLNCRDYKGMWQLCESAFCFAAEDEVTFNGFKCRDNILLTTYFQKYQ